MKQGSYLFNPSELARREREVVMNLNDGSRFLFLTLGVFSLMLGAAVLLFLLIERVFFAVSFVGDFIELSVVSVGVGTLLLLLFRRSRI